jgi:glutaredoxin
MKAHHTWIIWATGLVLGLGSCISQAQAVYRIVGPNGRITFTDTPPPTGVDQKISGRGGALAASADSALPYELQQVAARYPVTLYTGGNCGPCETGRNLLQARGIPFTERTVGTYDDAQALQRLSGQANLPVLSIGGQQLKGYSDAEWNQFLDLAGYPKSSQLPATYRGPAATPLVAVQRPAPAATAMENAATPRPAPQPPAEVPNNPTGIQF